MPVHLRLRHTDPEPSYPYVDTPDFAYADWLNTLARQGVPIGRVSGKPKVAIIGAGASGLCAAYELARAGCRVEIFEAGIAPGGRCDSVALGEGNIVELGAMRFPPSEFTLDFYLRHFGLVGDGGLAGLPNFPDPGVYNTFVGYGNETTIWRVATQSYPAGFEKVYHGWVAFVKEGITQAGVTVFQSAETIAKTLALRQVEQVTAYWQQYLDAFGQQSFYSVLFGLFSGASGYDIPGGAAWDFDDFDRFGALGVGSGGFGPLYPVAFNEIFRLIPNGLESAQRFFAPGIRALPDSFAQKLRDDFPDTCAWHLGTPIDTLRRHDATFELAWNQVHFRPFDRVIVATTTRAMEMTTNLTDVKGLVAEDVAKAIRRSHVVSSIKVAARIRRFWKENSPSDPAIRCLISDDALHQIYTLDYGALDTAVCFLSYTWDDDAVKQQALGVAHAGGQVDGSKLYYALLDMLQTGHPEIALWAQQLVPYPDPSSGILFVEWQSNPHFNGGFKLSQPGQDEYIRTLFYDYQKALAGDFGYPDSTDTGCYLAGDCLAWTSGWVEGALQTGLNAAAGVIASLGGNVNESSTGGSPLSINARRFTYFPGA